MAQLRIGTCSWKYPSWEGLVYSRREGIDFLGEYARRFDTVEIDQWFWSLHGPDTVTLPKPEVAQAYAAAVPADFRFTVKAPDSITLTHVRQRGAKSPLIPNAHFLSVDLFERFLETIVALHPNLGSVMLQFEYLNREKMPGRSAFLDRLGAFLERCPRGIPIGIETRNPRHIDASWFEFLSRHGAHHVWLQGYYMPSIFDLLRSHPPEGPGGVTVIRLHGPDRAGIEERGGGRWDRRIEPRDAELRALAACVPLLLSRGVDIYINVNNHYEGSAPLTIEALRAALQDVLQG
jgi:uncharacterized protein YecE (DUF72 family)